MLVWAPYAFAQSPTLSELHGTFKTKVDAKKSWPSHKPITPLGASIVHYPAEDGQLLGWLTNLSEISKAEPRPALVYLHGGWALGQSDVYNIQSFAKAGYIVFMPALRGENGNPGNYELFAGEVRDVIDAGRWIAAQDGVDPERIYLAGHSIGGGNAILAAMIPNSPFKRAASINGFYEQSDCKAIKRDWRATYKPQKPNECALRFPDSHWKELQIPITFYAGKKDRYMKSAMRRFRRQIDNTQNVKFIKVPGNHNSAVIPALDHFLEVISSPQIVDN